MTTVTVTVSNGRDSVTNSFRVTVRPVNDPLTVVSTSRGGGDGRFDRLASLAYTFSGDVSESLGPEDLMLVNAATGANVDLSQARVSWDAATRTAVWDLSQVAMVEGKYVATLKTSGLRDAEGNQLDGDGDGIPGGDYTQTITRTILGDADLDLTVGFADFVKLANHFGEEGTWLEGDFTGDNLISFDDFMALADNFGRSVRHAAVPAAVAVLAAREDFSRRRSR
jgi:hypothetical protein